MGGCCTKDRSTDTVRSKPSTNGRRDRSRNNPQRRPHQHEVELLDINEANEDQFAVLPGIGRKLAKDIIQYRAQHGPYQHVDDIMKVQGVGPQKMNKIRQKLTVKNAAATPSISEFPWQPLVYTLYLLLDKVKGRNVLRIGTWNLKCFNMEKVNDPVVVETVCLALLHSQYV